MEKIVLIGFGGHAKSVADSILQMNKYEIAGYTDAKKCDDAPYEYLGDDSALSEIFKSGVTNAFVCVGYLGKGNVREKIYENLKQIGFTLPVIIDPSAILARDVSFGEGTFVGKGAIVNSGAQIGSMCIINSGAIIEHECKLEDYVHVAVGAVLCGQVTVGRAAFVGANATVIQCMNIESKKLVPAGFTVRN